MKDPKNLSLILIPYLTICGVLYHISYWATFKINGLSFITISDIIKSSAHPVLSSTFPLLIGITIAYYFMYSNYKIEGLNSKELKEKQNKLFNKIILPIIWLLNFIVTPIISNNPSRWILFGFLMAIPLSILSDLYGVFNKLTDKAFNRVIISQLFFYFPIFSFTIGKLNSDTIFQNLKYKYTINQIKEPINKCNTNGDTLKLIGSSEKHFIFSNTNNEKIFFIKSDNIDTLILFDKK